jgi:hypothetical protein
MSRLSTLPLLVRWKLVTVDPGLIAACSEGTNRHWKSDDLRIPFPSVSLRVETDRSVGHLLKASILVSGLFHLPD